jgi:hypothetical protein
MDRLRNAAVSFGVSYVLGYALWRLVGSSSTGKLAGLVLGGAGAVASWVLSGTDGEPIEFGDDEPVEIEIEG